MHYGSHFKIHFLGSASFGKREVTTSEQKKRSALAAPSRQFSDCVRKYILAIFVIRCTLSIIVRGEIHPTVSGSFTETQSPTQNKHCWGINPEQDQRQKEVKKTCHIVCLTANTLVKIANNFADMIHVFVNFQISKVCIMLGKLKLGTPLLFRQGIFVFELLLLFWGVLRPSNDLPNKIQKHIHSTTG